MATKAGEAPKVSTILVTGAEGYLGRMAVRHFLSQGFKVAASCRTEEDQSTLREAVKDVSTAELVHVHSCDLTKEVEVRDMVQTAERQLGGIHAVLNAAGGFRFVPTVECSADDYDFLFDANVKSSWLLSKHVLPAMKDRGFGRLVFVSAHATLQPGTGGLGPYTASKMALNGLMATLATEWKETGIKINAVMPTIIDTPANRSAMGDAEAHKWVKTDDLLATVDYLLGPRGEAVHGAYWSVTGQL